MIREAIFTATVLLAASAAAPVTAGEVTITLTDLQTDAGDLFVSLQTQDNFMRGPDTASAKVENPQEATATVTIQDIPDGDYALMVWHDIDGDGTFSMGQMGPTDGWSMIGASEMRGMPSWEAQSFTLEGNASMTLTVIYPRDSQ